ncbi:Ig-like domain-containing protein [Catenulispora subtropica]|uniref:Bacterial Ig-like domain-containing protein n=1 Tax=Catenulispora subtropica TaxID=450798 RepID=A0ABN2QL40_9ACTN
MNFRKTLTTPHARRCSTAAIATAAAALMLTPATAFASGHPAGPERPARVGHDVKHSTSGHAGPGHAGHKNGHKNDQQPGHKKGRPSHHTGSAGTGAHHPKGVMHRVADPSTTDGASPDSGGTDRKPPSSNTPKTPKSDNQKTPKSGPKKSPESGPVATVTKLSMGKKLTSTRAVTMSARVSMAHRTAGTPRETGTVDFFVDGSSSGPIPISSNRASVKVKLSPGKHTATAKYSGDSAHSASESGPVSFTVSE